MPSATTRSPSEWAKWIVVATIGRLDACISRTKLRSILTSQIGKWASRIIDECPVPKSSTESAMP